MSPDLGNPILNTDSYKTSHWQQYPPQSEYAFSYVESRGGQYPATLFFGLQAILKEQLSRRVTHADIDLAAELLAAHGVPFNVEGWRDLVDRLGGILPIRIRAVAEGAVVPVHQILMSIENTDPAFYWLPSYIETLLLRVWYPTTVATISWHVRQDIAAALAQSSDAPEAQLPFTLHDFGARGVSTGASAAIGGLAHLVSFQGTDTLSALLAARLWYQEPMAGYSIPAAEHSTITSWGRDGEVEAYRNMLQAYARPGSILAVVSDSYDLHRAIREHWGQTLRSEVIASGATVVIRPDSGEPVDVVLASLQLLDAAYGCTVNSKGYRVLNHVRIIQGDGVNPHSIRQILSAVLAAGYSAENLAFGMGGALLQRLDRDTQRFALKCSAIRVAGQWREVYKQPATDPGKTSKRGRMTLIQEDATGAYRTVALPGDSVALAADELPPGWHEALTTVWENGQLLCDQTLAEVRARAGRVVPQF